MTSCIPKPDFPILNEGLSAKDVLESKIREASDTDDYDGFYVADLGDIVKKYVSWTRALPQVKPFYAVKCNNSHSVVWMLAQLGVGFDCASKAEIEQILNIGVSPERIIYANPWKQTSHMKYSASRGVLKMTFDDETELIKTKENYPNAKMLLCICTDDSTSMYPLSKKFGAPLKACRHLLEVAKDLSLDVIGVSFHVGSGCTKPWIYSQSIAEAKLVFNMGTELGHKMSVLDIGGGFPGTDDIKIKFEEFAAEINPALNQHFPPDCGVEIMAEPG
ncbi:ornithine decarboxylase 1-like [Latimeria chalumnae]|uniref:ornithine decarboxylase 1-like n=1 Tax=Latimeria chalumnae TaxID=7897 RepID=UPI00313ED122